MNNIQINDPTLNAGQRAAVEAFFGELFNTSKEFIISGPAGVGKTFLMKYIINNTMPQYLEMCSMMGIKPVFTNVVLTATTNKAAEVLGMAVGMPAQTIHSYLNLRVKNNYSTGSVDLIKTRNWDIKEQVIIFIDEASMIDHRLYDLLQESTFKCKIVYVGDHNQLPPVMESLSKIYLNKKTPFFELTEPMRNANQPALMNVCQQLRTTVETGEFKPIATVPGVIDLLDDTQLEAMLQKEFVTQNLNARILAYSNARVLQYNDYIRAFRQLPPDYQAGEWLVNNSSVKVTPKSSISVETLVKIVQVGSLQVEQLPHQGQLEYFPAKIETEYGMVFDHVKIPKDKAHFMALANYYAKAKIWDTHYMLKETYLDLRPREATTVHKAQGSTYDTVFIDLQNISTCKKPDEAARLLYVAFSRARNRIFLYGELAPKFGGLLKN